MDFWKNPIPDEPFISDGRQDQTRPSNKIPPAVKSWCLVSLAAIGLVVAVASLIFQNAGPLLVGTIFALLNLYMLVFWNDLASSANSSKQKAFERTPVAFQINLSVQWCAISICVAAPLMTVGVCVLLWFTYMQH
jgi:hypothetical protein